MFEDLIFFFCRLMKNRACRNYLSNFYVVKEASGFLIAEALLAKSSASR